MYAITGTFRAFCFDRAITTFGMALEAALDGVDGKSEKSINGKRQRLLDKWMERETRYRSPGMAPGAAPADEVVTMSGDGG